MAKIRTGIIGVGNCFAGLAQGMEYYRQNPKEQVIGLMHSKIGPYSWDDLEFSCAFDVGKSKVGQPLHSAAYASPNMVNWVPSLPVSSVVVKEAPVSDGVGIWVQNKVEPVSQSKNEGQLKKEIADEIISTKTEVLVNYLPVGSQKATEFWANVALETGCAFVNCIPVFIASEQKWEKKFADAKIPVVGDDIKAQVGATIVHRTLAKLCDDRGAVISKTYQINVGGNSVTGDQEILLIHNGNTVRTKIGDFVDRLAAVYGQKRADGKDEVEVSLTGQKIECFTIDEHFNVVTAEVSHLVRHSLGNGLYEIETAEGRKIKITADHNVFVLDDEGKLGEVPVSQLKEGVSMIAVPCSLPMQNETKPKSISLLPYYKELFAQGIDSNGNIMVHNHPEMRIPSELRVSDELLQVCGLWLADGNFDREGSSNIEIACGNDEECMGLLDSFASAYNINYQVRGQKQVAVRLMSKTMGKIFRLALGLGGNSYTKRVPSWFFSLSKRQIALVLRGYMSGDGTVVGRQIRWTTASEGLAEDMRTLFLQVGINSSIFREDYTNKNAKGSYKTALRYITHGIISSKEGAEAFIENVGFIQSYKNQKALAAAAKLTKGRTHLIPNIGLLSRFGIKSSNPHIPASLRAHTVLPQLEKVQDSQAKERIRGICSADTRFLRIKSIRKLPPIQQCVYDLSVPGYQRFICSNILVHNTDFLNMKEQERLASKRISKTESVQSQLRQRLPDENIYVGPSDFIPFLGNTKLMFMRIEGRMWAGMPFNMEVRLEVDDKANSAGVVIDAVRCAKLALERKMGGALVAPSAYFMKHPPAQMSDPDAREKTDEFIKGA